MKLQNINLKPDGANSPKNSSKSITQSPIVVTDAGGQSKTLSPVNRPSFLSEARFVDDHIEMGIELGSGKKKRILTFRCVPFKFSR